MEEEVSQKKRKAFLNNSKRSSSKVMPETIRSPSKLSKKSLSKTSIDMEKEKTNIGVVVALKPVVDE